MSWQPIDSAPRDGTPILTWHRHLGVMVAFWAGAGPVTTYAEPGWIGGHCRINHIDKPTHWMPLPEPPEHHAD